MRGSADADGVDERRELLREAYTMAFYVAICLLAVLSAVKDDRGADEVDVLGIVWGTTIGLAAAHWFAFRLSARLVGGGVASTHEAVLALAQLTGAASVALAVTVPILVLPATAELDAARAEIGIILGGAGYAVARAAGSRRATALAFAVGVLFLAMLVAVVKNTLGHH